jgi:hypothetical protein
MAVEAKSTDDAAMRGAIPTTTAATSRRTPESSREAAQPSRRFAVRRPLMVEAA